MNKILLFCLLGFVFFSCSNSSQSTNENANAVNTPPTAPAISPGEFLYPPIVTEDMQVLVEKTTLIDFIFYNHDFSMNLDNKAGIMNALRQIGEGAAPIRKECKATGRVIYQGDGDILMEADFYFQDPCFYFIFIEDDKPVKANIMTQEGMTFLGRLMSGVSTQAKQ